MERINGSPNAGIVMMQIDKDGLPIHADATAAIRSRIFLEGNFYVDLHPGTPQAPLLQLRRHTARRQHVRPGATGPHPVIARHERAGQSPEARPGFRGIAQQARRRRQDRRAGPQPGTRLFGRRIQDLGDRQPGAARGAARRSDGRGQGRGGDLPGPERQRRPAAAADRQLRRARCQRSRPANRTSSATIAALPPVLRATIAADSALQASFAPDRRPLPGR